MIVALGRGINVSGHPHFRVRCVFGHSCASDTGPGMADDLSQLEISAVPEC